MKNKIQLSIIIVHHNVKKELITCISSIIGSKPKVQFEIIIVDNDRKSRIKKELMNKFPKVKYIKSKNNLGYGGGNNLGARYAQGECLFFLNPDTIILDGALDNLYNFFIRNNNVGIISPVFLDDNLKPFKSQGSKELTPKTILFSQSLLKKIFPNRNIYNNSILNYWNMQDPIVTDTVPGAAMMISSGLFREIGGFDEKFFLYFEENDISKRVSNLRRKLYIVPTAKIVHFVGRSTRSLNNIENIYLRSRFFYLKKHHGVFKAIFTQTILSINKTFIFLLLILILAFFLRIINIENNMSFIGDQGWFYLSARDMLTTGRIPLVGIASSHPWLHQGPLWTYMLAGVFWLLGFNPLNGAYLTIMLGTLSVLLIYIMGSEMYSKRAGLISALLYATSPLVIVHSRTPYHTSPIPLFTLLYIYSLYKWIKGSSIFFPISILFLSILYNLELATVVLVFTLFAVLTYGMWKKTEWVKKIFSRKILIYSFLAFLIPMIPIIIYDFNNNFPQTFKFVVWTGYRILKFFGFPSIHGETDIVDLKTMVTFSFRFYQSLIFAASSIVSLVTLIFSFSVLFIDFYRLRHNRINHIGFFLLFLWISISGVGYFINNTASEAYLPVFFPALIYLVAFSFEKVMKIKPFFIPTVLLIILFVSINSYFVVLSENLIKGLNFSKRMSIAREVVREAGEREYNIVGSGDGSKFESFTMNYEYLAWWFGHSPSKSPQKLKFIIQENKDGAFLFKNE